MTIFIAHAPADASVAQELAAWLKTRASLAELQTADRPGRPLHSLDARVVFWSQAATMQSGRMALEQLALDAWAEGRLILVRLDHSFLPTSLRDLPSIDATFAARREFTWGEIADAARASTQLSGDLHLRRSAGPLQPTLPTPVAPAPDELSRRYAARARKAPPPEADDELDPEPLRRAPHADRSFQVGLASAGLLIGLGLISLREPVWRIIEDLSKEYLWVFLSPEVLSWTLIAIAALVLLAVAWVVLLAAARARKAPPPEADDELDAEDVQLGNTHLDGRRNWRNVLAEAADEFETPPPLPPLFISYASADSAEVLPKVDALGEGVPVWIDRKGLKSGQGWAGEIVAAIRSAKRVLVMCSPRAFESPHVLREVYLASRFEKPLLPVFLEETDPPDDFLYHFADVQWLKLYAVPEADRASALAAAALA